ncbi:MAG: radical SAM family heme chaperone HemW [bacterium]|nr:radical SAM family heme chaperone HemW [bacterium]
MQAQSSNHIIDNDTDQTVAAVYLHVPFCRSKCGYCDFYSLAAREELAGAYVRAISRELQIHAHHLTVPLDSIFVGGGTPTVLEPAILQELLEILAEYRNPHTEFSIEANPSTITGEVADLLHNAGVNRVNLGAQSFVNAELTALGRTHDPDQIITAWKTLRDRGHKRLGLDLIYGAPGQSPDSWQFSLDEAMKLKPEHLSCYALTVESNTDIGRQRDSGKFVEMDESDQVECYHTTVETTRNAGLQQYEISNFSLPGKHCRHNRTYWLNQPYLGLGPAAASYINGIRQTNKPDLDAYIQALDNGCQPPCVSEELTGRAEMGETVMLALRMVEGVDRGRFIARFGVDVAEVFARSIERYCDLGAMQLTDRYLRIAPDAMLVSNTILADILAEV